MIRDIRRLQSILHQIIRNLQFLRGDKVEFIARVAHQAVHQRVYRPTEFQVAAETNLQMIQMPLALPYGQQIDHGLGGVVMSAVPGIDHRNPGIHGSPQRRTLLGMPHGDDVRITADHPRGICHRLAFGGTALLRPGKSQCPTAKIQHGGLKRKSGTGAGLVK